VRSAQVALVGRVEANFKSPECLLENCPYKLTPRYRVKQPIQKHSPDPIHSDIDLWCDAKLDWLDALKPNSVKCLFHYSDSTWIIA